MFSWSSSWTQNKRILFSIRKPNRNPWLHALGWTTFPYASSVLLFFLFFLHNISSFLIYNSCKKIIILNSYAFYVAYPHRRSMCVGSSRSSLSSAPFAPREETLSGVSKSWIWMLELKCRDRPCRCHGNVCTENNPLFIIYNLNCLKSFPSIVAGA